LARVELGLRVPGVSGQGDANVIVGRAADYVRPAIEFQVDFSCGDDRFVRDHRLRGWTRVVTGAGALAGGMAGRCQKRTRDEYREGCRWFHMARLLAVLPAWQESGFGTMSDIGGDGSIRPLTHHQ